MPRAKRSVTTIRLGFMEKAQRLSPFRALHYIADRFHRRQPEKLEMVKEKIDSMKKKLPEYGLFLWHFLPMNHFIASTKYGTWVYVAAKREVRKRLPLRDYKRPRPLTHEETEIALLDTMSAEHARVVKTNRGTWRFTPTAARAVEPRTASPRVS